MVRSFVSRLFKVFSLTVFVLYTHPLLAKPQHGIDLYGSLKYPADFTHVDYVNPNAPKGGAVTYAAIGAFDSLNPFVIKGHPAAGMTYLYPSYFYATLMAPTQDEPFASYGYVAETVDLAEDRKTVTFTLRKEATFHDGSPITAEDVVFSFNILKEKGIPFFKAYYREVVKAEVLGKRKVRFTIQDPKNREVPSIIGQFPILPKAYYDTRDFEKADLVVPIGSGPYKIKEFDAGKSITYERIPNWWGENIPVRKGLDNFDLITYLYFRDSTVAFEAFKAGTIDFQLETSSKNWATGYDFKAITSGQVKKVELPDSTTKGMQGFAFNLRRDIFSDIRVRKAISLALDFEWTNENLFYGTYKRSNSYFENGELRSSGLPQGDELAILEPFRDQLPESVFTTEFKMPVNKKPGDIRKQLKKATKLLEEAGWDIQDGTLINLKTRQPFEFEILIVSPDFVRVCNGFVRNLKRLGITANVRVVDTAQYIARVEDFDFDIIVGGFPQSESPGNEQIEFWTSKVADIKGSRNVIGIKNKVIDHLVEDILDAETRKDLVTHVHALDRVLLHHYYMVPHWFSGKHRIAYWNKFGRPSQVPPYGIGLDTWWVEPKEGASKQTRKKA